MHWKGDKCEHLQHELVLVHGVVLGFPVTQPVRKARYAGAFVHSGLAVAFAAHVTCGSANEP